MGMRGRRKGDKGTLGKSQLVVTMYLRGPRQRSGHRARRRGVEGKEKGRGGIKHELFDIID